MGYRVTGWNEFHEGWLAYLFGEPRDNRQSDGWLCGFDCAAESALDTVRGAFVAMRELDQVRVVRSKIARVPA
jgi:hypothetical protein